LKKTIAILTLGMIMIISAIAPSCLSDCRRSDRRSSKFYTTQIFGETYDISLKSKEITDTSVVRHNYLRVSIKFSGKYYSEVIRNLSFISSALACDPGEPYSEEKITAITITANQDFDALHPAGTNLNDVFYVQYYSLSGSTFTIEEFLKTSPKVGNLLFLLASAPDVQKQIQFTITYEFDGKLVKVLKYETPSFILSSY
jgi:hypothetical protein